MTYITAINNYALESAGFSYLHASTQIGQERVFFSTFTNNTAYNGSGGAFYCAAFDQYYDGLQPMKSLSFYNCTFRLNRALLGGLGGAHDRLSRDLFVGDCDRRYFTFALRNLRSCTEQYEGTTLVSIYDMLMTRDAILNGVNYTYDAKINDHVVKTWPSLDELGAYREDWADDAIYYMIQTQNYTHDNTLGSGGAVAFLAPYNGQYTTIQNTVSFEHCELEYNYASFFGGSISGFGVIRPGMWNNVSISNSIAFHSGGGAALMTRPRTTAKYPSINMNYISIMLNEAVMGHANLLLHHLHATISGSFYIKYNWAHKSSGGVSFNLRDVMESTQVKVTMLTFYYADKPGYEGIQNLYVISNNYVIRGAGGMY